MSKVRDFSKERKDLQKSGVLPDWMTTQGWQLFSTKYMNGESKSLKDQHKRIAKTLASYIKDVYPDWWDDNEYFKGKTWEEAFFSVMFDGFISPSTPVLTNTGTNFG